jgi:hypothetical protein
VPCLLVLLAILAPRVVSVVLWLFTSFFAAAFGHQPLVLLLGVIFLPFTTLTYAWMVNAYGAVGGTPSVVLLVIAALIDLSSYEGGRRRYRR